jgi:HrpA-like RNA helicase
VSPRTRIRFVTDTVLLDEYRADPCLNNYAIVIIDEVQERRVNTDLLFGVMKQCLRQRKDLRVSYLIKIMPSLYLN